MQERAILLLWSETGKHEDFAQQREVFFNMYGNRNIQIVMTINSVGKKLYEPEDTIGFGTITKCCLFLQSMRLGKLPLKSRQKLCFWNRTG